MDTRDWGRVALYDPAAADKMKPLPSAKKIQMEARRTCPTCHKVRDHIVRGKRCTVCLERARAAQLRAAARTCRRCQAVRERPYPAAHGMCAECRRQVLAEERERADRWVEKVTVCAGPGCSARMGSKRAARAWRRAGKHHWSYRPDGWLERCAPCQEAHEREQAERWERLERERAAAAREAREARERQVRELVEWAAAVLADPSAVVLDTETTGLHDSARIVEISALSIGGEVLVDTLLNPGEPIPADSSAIHKIYDSDVAGAPRFGEVLVQLTAALDGRRVLVYNAPFDRGRLRYELMEHYRAAGHEDPAESAAAWLAQMRIEDAMGPYSDWVGDYDEYWGAYRWQALNGGHRALKDCRAVVERLQEMTEAADGEAFEVA
ncbi:3'-5' exonuclease [Streptomyces decoyicus]|uniref:3'-5' exonuclease n=1 Tax=Streptomyces decoyicus TaxID=249567 RepID=UPI003624B86B